MFDIFADFIPRVRLHVHAQGLMLYADVTRVTVVKEVVLLSVVIIMNASDIDI